MKTSLMQLMFVSCLGFASERSVWSQSSLYFARPNFVAASQAIPGNIQSISSFPWANGPVLTISDVTFRGRYLGLGPNSFLYNFDGSPPGISIHFANGAQAFGADFSSYLPPDYPSTFTATLSLDDGETFSFTASIAPNFRFFGFISATTIMDVTFSDGGLYGVDHMHEELIGNLYMVTEIPEPAGIALAGVGAALLLGWRFSRGRLFSPRSGSQ
jgi:hypothetical protein